MRFPTVFAVAALLLVTTAPAHAQYDRSGRRRGPEDFRHRGPTHADSLRTLAGPWQVWGHAGMGWLSSPSDVRARYHPGLEVGVTGDRRLANRLALRARLGFQDMPSTQPTAIVIGNVAYPTNEDYGHAWSGSFEGGIAASPWNHVWLDAGAGAGYFQNGFRDQLTFVDGATGETLTVRGDTGWGSTWSAGARYEFKPTLRDRLLAEVRVSALMRDGATLRFISFGVGYRAF